LEDVGWQRVAIEKEANIYFALFYASSLLRPFMIELRDKLRHYQIGLCQTR
jgi:hypothetical protein